MAEKGSSRNGRPPWSPSIEDRLAVERMKYCGESEEAIARALKVDVDTMRKHCGEELANGYAQRRRQVIGKLFEQAEGGNMTALNKLVDMGVVSGAQERVQDKTRPAKPVKLGKKEERQQAAERVTGKYAVPDGPKLVVSNVG